MLKENTIHNDNYVFDGLAQENVSLEIKIHRAMISDRIDVDELDLLLQVSNWVIKSPFRNIVPNLRQLIVHFFKENEFIIIDDGIKELDICLTYLDSNKLEISSSSIQKIYQKFQNQPSLRYLL